jgi:hypothetical protein
MLPPHVHRAEHGDCGAALARGAATALPRVPRRGLGAGVGVVPDVRAGRHQSRVSLTTTSWILRTSPAKPVHFLGVCPAVLLGASKQAPQHSNVPHLRMDELSVQLIPYFGK